MNVKDRFDQKWESDPTSECHIWKAAKYKNGYGVFWDGKKRNGAHRVSFSLSKGTIPEGMYVCHHCDNPSCVNPKHLFLGTPKDNSEDKFEKNRARVGSQHPRAKLTLEQVEKIRLASGSQKEIAKNFGVSQSTIHTIKTGKNWKK